MKIIKDRVYYDDYLNPIEYWVYLNGEKQENFFEADDQEGYVIIEEEVYYGWGTSKSLKHSKKYGRVHIVRILE